MANRLKNMRLTSVDLVRNGANQEADICLFKSADPEEDPVQPTTEEKNIFKRFINWMRENHADDPQDDEETVEKDYSTFNSLNAARESNEKLWQYTNALTESIRSIQMDQDLSKDQKYQLMVESLDQFDAAMDDLIEILSGTTPGGLAKSDPEEDVEKFNPYHGADGRFSSAGGGGKFYATPGKSKAHDLAIEREAKRNAAGGGAAAGAGGSKDGGKGQAKFDDDKQTKEVQNIKGYVGDDKVYDEIDSKLSPLFGDGKDTRLYDYDLEYGGIDKVSFFGADEVSNGKTTALVSFWAKDVTTGKRVGMEDQIEVRVVRKSADFDEIEEV